MKTILSSKRVLPILASALSLLYAGCGAQTALQESDVQDWQSSPYDERFSQAQIDAVYTQETDEFGPINLPLINDVYDESNMPDELANEYGEMTYIAETRGYLHTGKSTIPAWQSVLIRNFEAVRSWEEIQDLNGKPVFKRTRTLDSKGKEINDVVDGIAPREGEIIPVKLKLNSSPISVTAQGELELFNRDGEIQADIITTKSVKVPIFGTVVKPGNLKIHLKFYPYGNGWLFYGATAVKLEKLKDRVEPEMFDTVVGSLFDWLKGKMIF